MPRKSGWMSNIFLIIGMPGETKEQMWDSFRLAEELEIYSPFISIATPYPGSELYDICREEKYIPDDFSLDNLFIRSFSISTPGLDRRRTKGYIKARAKVSADIVFEKASVEVYGRYF